MNVAPRGIRPHIAIFGRRNVGKSSIINSLTGQNIALVSETPGTTTDPVYKNMEILPLGPVVFIDTAGLDDVGALGSMRVEASLAVLKKTDLALVVLEPAHILDSCELELLAALKTAGTPFLVIVNKCDEEGVPETMGAQLLGMGVTPIPVSAKTGKGIEALRGTHITQKLKDFDAGTILGDLVSPGDFVVLVVPIDSAAPKGRIILPQVQSIRDLLDSGCIPVVTREHELRAAIAGLAKPPALVVTDSQVFRKVSEDVPKGIPFTSFSVVFARYKGDLATYVAGVKSLDTLKPDARILIVEACTHHQMPDDIGRVKIPRWMREKFGPGLRFEYARGSVLPADLKSFDLAVQCGGCMANRRGILSQMSAVAEAGVPITNYGILIAWLHGVLDEAIRPFGLHKTV
ncbi:MAG TPA: [FeFe] hydrogenase H-cluster maturation GTPase HydF [Candidatus Ozemobacteraceae bacterium]|nr:[FeFe] hydrogenase H-cluster maturation GTPase HydF [Candidatus Ozemobacteraceae bacterium]